jgi:hypothetical protein
MVQTEGGVKARTKAVSRFNRVSHEGILEPDK